MDNIKTLSPIQYQIIKEICRALAAHGADIGYLGIIGSWGDTLPEAEILEQLKELNDNNR